jgi:molybdopterin molybdotransferase
VSETTFEVRTPDWIGLDVARRRILSQAVPLDSELVSVSDALGRASASAHTARATLPPWDNSAMDGYAVRGSDINGATAAAPVELTVTGAVRAGQATEQALGVGEAIRIMTGAPLPGGADCVVRVEDTDAEKESGKVRIFHDRDVGRNVRPAGEDMRAGAPMLETGHSVTPGTIAALSALGLASVSVTKRPTVAILATGDELLPVSRYPEVLAGGGIPESNGPMLAAAVRAAGATPLCGEIVPDDKKALRERIESVRDADVLVTIGGASMGEADLVKRVLDEVGFRQDFWRVRLRPGSPFGFGWLPRDTGRDQAVFSLPGNPVSAFVTFELFVRPYLLATGGHTRVYRRTIRCTAGERLPGPAGLAYFLRVSLDEGPTPPVARLAGPQGSGLVRTLASADGLAIVPEDVTEIRAGEDVDVMLTDDAPAAGLFEPSATA